MEKLKLTLQVIVAVAALPTLAFMEVNHGAKRQQSNEKATIEQVQKKQASAALAADGNCVNMPQADVLLNLVVSN
jgi:hypothetical protein